MPAKNRKPLFALLALLVVGAGAAYFFIGSGDSVVTPAVARKAAVQPPDLDSDVPPQADEPQSPPNSEADTGGRLSADNAPVTELEPSEADQAPEAKKPDSKRPKRKRPSARTAPEEEAVGEEPTAAKKPPVGL